MWTAGARQRIPPRLDAPIGLTRHGAAGAFSAREAPLGVGERSGRLRPYVRPVARCSPLAITGVRVRVRRQSGSRARGTPPSTASPELSRPHSARPVACERRHGRGSDPGISYVEAPTRKVARRGATRPDSAGGSDLVRSLRRIGPPGAVGTDLDQDEAAFLLVIGRPRRVRPNRAGSRAPRRRRTSLPAPSRACPLLQAWRRSGTGLGSRPSGKATTRSPTRWKVRSTIAPPTTRRRIVSRSMPVGSRGRST